MQRLHVSFYKSPLLQAFTVHLYCDIPNKITQRQILHFLLKQIIDDKFGGLEGNMRLQCSIVR